MVGGLARSHHKIGIMGAETFDSVLRKDSLEI
jgi:hypothetical protein